ncbi:Protein MS5 [Arabidopsis suecica]|uniref:Protein MS5 n=1 Tax=Arabidopsis suecica TaxID=45249 RepID=A0A8T1YHX4_ARASU|nr:Protein MS5 [Arabidopsis suecica]
MEAVDPADNYSLYSLRTWVKHDEHANTVLSTWETCFCDVRDGEEADHEWDNEAIDDQYKGEMPKWFSDDDLQHCYVLKDSELMDPNLHLFAEFAFYKKWCLQFWPEDIAGCLPLDIQKVVVETGGEAETEPREKLKAANAIFYISFQCVYDPVTGEEADYRAVVRKTMDGKPGHIRLEVSVGAPNQADGSEER